MNYTTHNYNSDVQSMLSEFNTWKAEDKPWRLIIYDDASGNLKHHEVYYSTEEECNLFLFEMYSRFLDYYGDNVHKYDYDEDLIFDSEYDFIVIESIDNTIKACPGDHWYYMCEGLLPIIVNNEPLSTLIYRLQ